MEKISEKEFRETVELLVNMCARTKAILRQSEKMDATDHLLVEAMNAAVKSDFSEIAKPIPKVLQLYLAAVNEIYRIKNGESGTE
jgi:hypothetical protein